MLSDLGIALLYLLAQLSFFILVIVLLVLSIKHKNTLNKLERRIKSIEKTLNLSEGEGKLLPSQIDKHFTEDIISAQKTKAPSAFSSFISWLKINWIMKLGALLIILGFGWFLGYAFLKNWIGPAGRIALGFISALIFLLIGWQRIQKYFVQGSILLLLGSTINLLTIFSARYLYNFFNESVALTVIFLNAALISFVSVIYKSEVLSTIGIIVGGIAPLLVRSPQGAEMPINAVGFFSYLVAVIIGSLWIVYLTQNRKLTIIALAVVAGYSIPFLFSTDTIPYSGKLIDLLPFIAVLSFLFFLTNTLEFLKSEKPVADIITSGGNGLLLLLWLIKSLNLEIQSIIISLIALIFVILSYLIFSFTKNIKPFLTYVGMGGVYIATATSIELVGPALIIALTIEIFALCLLVYLVTKDLNITANLSILFLWPIFLSFETIFSSDWRSKDYGVFHQAFFALFTLALTMLFLGIFFQRQGQSQSKNIKNIILYLIAFGSAYLYLLIWRSLHQIFTVIITIQNGEYLATFICLAIYTLIGLISYFVGLFKKISALRIYGAILIGLVVIRILLIDAWLMAITYRIITLFVIGLLLLMTAFLEVSRRKNKI